MTERIFHPENLARVPIWGDQLVANFEERVKEVELASRRFIDPNVTVLMRTKNDRDDVEGILTDIDRQRSVDGMDGMFTGDVQVVLVDTESSDGTVEVAREWGAEVIPIAQEGFNYPNALNRGFEAAEYPHVFSIVGHSAISNIRWLQVATRHQNENLAGVAGVSLPNADTRLFEGVTNIDTYRRLREPAGLVTKMRMGLLAANSSVYRLDAWRELGGFDERFAAGGEDADFARRAIEAGMGIMADAGASVYHSHGLGALDSIRQFQYWSKLGGPRDFDQAKLLSYRPDLRAKSQD